MMMIQFLIFVIFVIVLILILLLLNLLLSKHQPYSEKVEVYECGFHAVGEQTRSAFNIQFFLIALLFMIFDVELILFIPIVTSMNQVESYGFIIAMLFLILLTLGFIFEIGKGALNIKNILPFGIQNSFTNSLSK
jgi:NADH-ubiquinone oxidoreductase chain 3